MDEQAPQAAAADGNMSDQDLQALMAQLGGVSADPEKLAALKQQMALSNSIRQSNPTPQGVQTRGDHGGVYVGPSALETLGHTLGNVIATQQDSKAQKGMTDMAQQEQLARTGYMQMLADQLRKQQGGGALADQSGNGFAVGLDQ